MDVIRKTIPEIQTFKNHVVMNSVPIIRLFFPNKTILNIAVASVLCHVFSLIMKIMLAELSGPHKERAKSFSSLLQEYCFPNFAIESLQNEKIKQQQSNQYKCQKTTSLI